MQVQSNPHKGFVFKLHWVLMELLFHGRNHVVVNEILCKFYKAEIAIADSIIEWYQVPQGRKPAAKAVTDGS